MQELGCLELRRCRAVGSQQQMETAQWSAHNCSVVWDLRISQHVYRYKKVGSRMRANAPLCVWNI